MSRVTFVLACHRSGSSVITYGIEALGATIPGDLIPGGYGNPRGYGESFTVMRINDDLLKALGYNWASPDFDRSRLDINASNLIPFRARIAAFLLETIKTSQISVIKDPRLPYVLPLWLEVCRNLSIDVCTIAAVRHPVAVAHSLMKRDHMPSEHAFALWRSHIEHTLFYPINIFVDYDRLMASPHLELERVRNTLFWLPLRGTPEAIDNFCHDFLDPNLQRNSVPLSTRTSDPEINRLWETVYERACT